MKKCYLKIIDFLFKMRYNIYRGDDIMEKHSALQVAKWFLAHNRIAMNEEGAEYISNLKLQKLLYYAQGTFLALKGEKLFPEKILAWQHGPVVEEVYSYYKNNGASGIRFDEDFEISRFTDEENQILTDVYDTFGQYSAWKLRNMTHAETPWQETLANKEISLESIEKYFKRNYIEE